MVVGNWILFTDLALMIVLVAFCVRALRLPNTFKHSKRLTELEVSLRTLIREAATSGATFNDELVTRKQELERLLLELEQNGARMSSVKEASKNVLNDLARIEDRGDEICQRLDREIRSAEKLLESFQSSVEEKVSGEAPEPPSFKAAVSVADSKPVEAIKALESEVEVHQPEIEVVQPVRQAQTALEDMVEQVIESSSSVKNSTDDDFVELDDIPVFKEHNI